MGAWISWGTDWGCSGEMRREGARDFSFSAVKERSLLYIMVWYDFNFQLFGDRAGNAIAFLCLHTSLIENISFANHNRYLISDNRYFYENERQAMLAWALQTPKNE
jgi:hypothetical protein